MSVRPKKFHAGFHEEAPSVARDVTLNYGSSAGLHTGNRKLAFVSWSWPVT
jgi:hypothetical protein